MKIRLTLKIGITEQQTELGEREPEIIGGLVHEVIAIHQGAADEFEQTYNS